MSAYKLDGSIAVTVAVSLDAVYRDPSNPIDCPLPETVAVPFLNAARLAGVAIEGEVCAVVEDMNGFPQPWTVAIRQIESQKCIARFFPEHLEEMRLGMASMASLLVALTARAKGEEVSEYRIASLYADLVADKLSGNLSMEDAVSVLARDAKVSRMAARRAMEDAIQRRILSEKTGNRP